METDLAEEEKKDVAWTSSQITFVVAKKVKTVVATGNLIFDCFVVGVLSFGFGSFDFLNNSVSQTSLTS